MTIDKYIDIDGQRLHYTVSGQGPAIILMHGWGCNTATMASIEAVAAETNTVYNIDFPGFGLSPEPAQIWDVYDYARMLEGFITALDIERPSLLGHSFGGRVAIIHASSHEVDKVILTDAAGIKPHHSLKYYIKVYSYKFAKKVAPLLLGRKLGQKIIGWWQGKSGSADYRSASPKMRAIMSKVVNEDLRHLLPKISAPTLLIWGEKDTATPLSDAKIMEKMIPGAGLVSFAGCGHYSFLDNPVGYAAVLRSFLHS